MCQRAGGGEKGTCVQVLNLPKTGYLTWRKSKKSTSMNWAGRDHPRSRKKLCRQGPWVLGNKRLTLSLCTPLHLVGDWPRLHHRQYHLSGMLGGQSRYDLFNTQQGVKGNSPAWSQETKRQQQEQGVHRHTRGGSYQAAMGLMEQNGRGGENECEKKTGKNKQLVSFRQWFARKRRLQAKDGRVKNTHRPAGHSWGRKGREQRHSPSL